MGCSLDGCSPFFFVTAIFETAACTLEQRTGTDDSIYGIHGKK